MYTILDLVPEDPKVKKLKDFSNNERVTYAFKNSRWYESFCYSRIVKLATFLQYILYTSTNCAIIFAITRSTQPVEVIESLSFN